MLRRPTFQVMSYAAFYFFLFSCFLSPYYACNQLDRISLLSFSGKISFLPDYNLLNWSSIVDCCHWEGISCNNNGRVTHLRLSEKSLVGGLSPSLGNLTYLSYLNLSHNSLFGSLPTGMLSYLNHLDVLDLSFNNLSGQLPYEIYNIPTLREISLSFNLFWGPIGDGIGNLLNLEKLLLNSNRLTGYLPPSLMNCTNLSIIDLCDNLLEGDISDLNFTKLQRLSTLDFGHNNFTGNLPHTIYSCKSMVVMRFVQNKLEGQILPAILELHSLSFLSLSDNRLSNISGAIRILMRCKNLNVVFLSLNFKDEIMPNDNNLVSLNGFRNCKVLCLRRCHLTGRVPNWLSRLNKLEFLDLSDNQLEGSIPSWLGTLPSLFFLNLSHNFLSGDFPKHLCKLRTLTSEKAAAQVDHSYLKLPIFRQPTDATNLCYNRLSNIPPSIIMSNNNLSGQIPTEIGQLKLLHVLNLSYNKFSGCISEDISNLINLETLDLSTNHLSGEIPASLGRLTFLSSFNISNNNVRGTIPLCTQLQSFLASSYAGNPGLCGDPLPNKCQTTSGDHQDYKQISGRIQEEEDEISGPWFDDIVIVLIGYITGFSVVCGTLFIHTSWRHAYFQFLNNVAAVIVGRRLQRRL